LPMRKYLLPLLFILLAPNALLAKSDTSIRQVDSLSKQGPGIQVVVHYYQLLNKQEYAKAFALLSERYRDAHPYNEWLKQYAGMTNIYLSIDKNSTDSLVHVRLKAVRANKKGYDYPEFFGTWQTVMYNDPNHGPMRYLDDSHILDGEEN